MNRKIGTYKIPSEFKDEDKWFKYFTVPQLFALLGGMVVCWGIFCVFRTFHLTFIGACVDIVLFALLVLCIYAPMPHNKYLMGGGQPFRVIFFRILRKRMPSNKKLYVKNYEKENDE